MIFLTRSPFERLPAVPPNSAAEAVIISNKHKVNICRLGVKE